MRNGIVHSKLRSAYLCVKAVPCCLSYLYVFLICLHLCVQACRAHGEIQSKAGEHVWSIGWQESQHNFTFHGRYPREVVSSTSSRCTSIKTSWFEFFFHVIFGHQLSWYAWGGVGVCTFKVLLMMLNQSMVYFNPSFSKQDNLFKFQK